MAQTTTQVLTTAVKGAHWLLDVTFADVDDDLANRPAPGNANPLGTAYAHLVLSEDAIVNGLLRGEAPLSVSTRAGRTGVDLPMPIHGITEGDLGAWYADARVSVDEMKDYAAEVFAATEQYVAGLDDAGLERTIELPFGDKGPVPVSEAITMLVIQHCDNYTGEISAIKGVFGLKGYPF